MTPSTLTVASSVSEVRTAWNAAVRATRTAAGAACERGYAPRIQQIEVLACGPHGRVGEPLGYVESVNDLTLEALAVWADAARKVGATYVALDGAWDGVATDGDYEPLGVYAELDLAL